MGSMKSPIDHQQCQSMGPWHYSFPLLIFRVRCSYLTWSQLLGAWEGWFRMDQSCIVFFLSWSPHLHSSTDSGPGGTLRIYLLLEQFCSQEEKEATEPSMPNLVFLSWSMSHHFTSPVAGRCGGKMVAAGVPSTCKKTSRDSRQYLPLQKLFIKFLLYANAHGW